MILLGILTGTQLLLAGIAPAEEASERGQRLFDTHCARCHGIGGAGGVGPSLAHPRLRHAADDEALVRVIRTGIEGTEMPATWQISEGEAREVAVYVRSLGRVEPEDLGGDAERGRALFEGASGCTGCHTVKGEGGILGPDLTEVGLRRGASYLRESIENPDAVVAPEFLQVRAITADGREISGVRMNEDAFTIQLRDASGRFHSLPKLELQNFEKLFGRSAMPSYGSDIGEEEIEDLVAFLASLTGKP